MIAGGERESGSNCHLQELYQNLAPSIGPSITPERVQRVIDESNRGHHLIHGIKYDSLVPQVQSEGVKPMTPEGRASYWASGLRIFANRGEWTPLATYDTPFFQYSHSQSPDPEYHGSIMTAAITNTELLEEVGHVAVSDNSYLGINFEIPRRSVCLLRVEAPDSQTAQAAMFGLLERAMTEGYEPGGYLSAKLS